MWNERHFVVFIWFSLLPSWACAPAPNDWISEVTEKCETTDFLPEGSEDQRNAVYCLLLWLRLNHHKA